MKNKKEPSLELPPNHPWIMVKRMVKESVGRLPTPLVLIFLFSLSLAVVAGVFVELAKPPSHPYEHLPLRLQVQTEEAKLRTKTLQGKWITKISKYTMSLQFEDSMFEWMVMEDGEDQLRYFARGNYKVEGNVLILGQRPDMGVPYDPKNRFIAYLPLSLKNVNVYARLDSRGLSWIIPPEERGHLLPQLLRFLPLRADAPLLWKKVSR